MLEDTGAGIDKFKELEEQYKRIQGVVLIDEEGVQEELEGEWVNLEKR